MKKINFSSVFFFLIIFFMLKIRGEIFLYKWIISHYSVLFFCRLVNLCTNHFVYFFLNIKLQIFGLKDRYTKMRRTITRAPELFEVSVRTKHMEINDQLLSPTFYCLLLSQNLYTYFWIYCHRTFVFIPWYRVWLKKKKIMFKI